MPFSLTTARRSSLILVAVSVSAGLAAPLAPAQSTSPAPTPTPTPTAASSAASSGPAPTPTAATAKGDPTPTAPESSEVPGVAGTSSPAPSPIDQVAPTPTPTPSPSARQTAAAAALALSAPSSLPVCQPLAVSGTATPGATIVVDQALSAWRLQVATAVADASGSWRATVRADECYPGTFQLRVRSGGLTSAVSRLTRTGDRPTYSILVRQPTHTSTALHRPWGALSVTGRISVPVQTQIALWQMSTDRRSARVIARTTSSPTGAYAFSVGFPATDGTGLFVDSGLGAGAQRSAVVNVASSRGDVRLSAPATTDARARTTVSGVLVPSAAGRRVYVHVLLGGTWRQAVTGATTTGGRFSLPVDWLTTRRGTFRLRAGAVQPDGSVVWGSSVLHQRTASLRPVVRYTTSADVATTYRSGCPVGPSGLRTIEMNHIAYDGTVQRGEMVVRKDLAPAVVAAFTQGMAGNFPIKHLHNPNVYGGDDVRMMAAGNTSAFNCRRVTGNPYRLSPHSYGKAIDVNPIENPYRDPNGRWYPSTRYASYRPASVKGLLVSSSSLTRGLRGQGFAWYTGWDWQHFQR